MAEERVQRRLTTILAADVVGYSRLMGEDEAGTLAALKHRRREVLAPLVSQHGGRIFKLMGDGVLVEFPSVVNAVQCAVEIQKGMAAANAGAAGEQAGLAAHRRQSGRCDRRGRRSLWRRRQSRRPAGGAGRAGRHLPVRHGPSACRHQAAARLSATWASSPVKNFAKPVRVYSIGTRIGDAAAQRRRHGPSARQAGHRRAALRQYERRSGAGVLRRRPDRGHPDRALALSRSAGHLAQHLEPLQGQGRSM